MQASTLRLCSPISVTRSYEILIRTIVVSEGNMQVNKLHKKSSALVKAAAQAEFLMAIEDDLTEEEHAVYKRGRNAKSFSMAKNATMKDYRMATGFEALMGYLYLSGRTERMVDLVALAMTKPEKLTPAIWKNQKEENSDEI